jgi:mono/diheme cytochrome c family protein
MRTRLIAAIIIGSVIGLWFLSVGAQRDASAQTESQAASGPRSVWDGVYTEEQAKRGQSLYQTKCASCHGDKMTGGESAPPLTGGQFLSNWNGLTLDVLFERIRVTMPSDNPAKVPRPAKADILAYLLSMNTFPAGKSELQYRAELLKGILIETKDQHAHSSRR